MNTVQRIGKNVGFLLISQIITYILGLFYTLYTARYLGADGFGILSIAFAWTAILGTSTDLGLNLLAVREIARNISLSGKYISNILSIKLILSIVYLMIIILLINYLSYSQQTSNVIYLIAFASVFNGFSTFFQAIFQSHEKMEYQSLGIVLNSTLLLLITFFAISQRFDVVGLALIYMIVSLISLFYNSIMCGWKFEIPKLDFDFVFWKSAILNALPFGFSAIFALTYMYVDSILLSMIKGVMVVGWYNAAYRLVISLSLIPTVYFTAIFPVTSRFFKTSNEYLKLTYSRSLKYLMIISIPMCVWITILSEKIILMIFGAGYQESISILQILIWAEFFIFVSLVFAYLLRSINKQKADAKATMFGAFLNIILNLVLIPYYSYIGSAFATVITEACVLIILIKVTSSSGYKILNSVFFIDMLKFTIASLISGLFIIMFINVNVLIILGLSAMIYLILIYCFKSFDEVDEFLFKRLIQRFDFIR